MSHLRTTLKQVVLLCFLLVASAADLHAQYRSGQGVGEDTMLRFEARARAIQPSGGEPLDLTAGIEWASD
jgi:hypothetical protein